MTVIQLSYSPSESGPDLYHVASSMYARARSLREEADILERDANELRRVLEKDREWCSMCGGRGVAIHGGGPAGPNPLRTCMTCDGTGKRR